MTNPKVFEFAKEIGMAPLALMDKIKAWGLPVKTHMEELSPDLLETIRSKLAQKAGASEASGEKKAVRKKAPVAAKPEAPIKPTGTKPAAKMAITKPTTKATIIKAAPTSAAPVPEAEMPKSSATVVRRKSRADELKAEAEAAALIAAEKAEADKEAAIEAAALASAEAEERLINEAATREIEKQKVAAQASVKSAEAATVKAAQPAVETSVAAVSAPAAAPVTSQAIAAGVAAKVVARKKEVAIGNSGVTSDATPPVARRNIIGRMDLSRVQAPPGHRGPGQRPQGAGGPPDRGGQRGPVPSQTGTGMAFRSKGNLRAGFVQATPAPAVDGPNWMSEEENRKRDEKKRMRGGAPDSSAVREPTEGEQPPAFDAAEYRKREMVFQPKKKKGILGRPSNATKITIAAAHKRVVKVNGSMKVSELGQNMGVKAAEIIKVLMKNGMMVNMNSDLDFDTIALIAPEFKFEAQSVHVTSVDMVGQLAFGNLEAEKIIRPPVVAVMGHVDHGKTSLLDAIRSARVAQGEAGGITQHIGAYQVTLDDGYKITFLDTPGHEAFTAMRARGANVTDIAIIVVAADDGVMPQTAEAINHAKAAKVPLIIAINKMDKPSANPDKIKQQLTEYQVVPEEWGGDAIFVPVSALKKTGIPELLQQIRLLAEVGELMANPERSATGTVIESRLDKGRGPVATLLIKDGTIKVGQYLVAGTVPCRVRSLINDQGKRVDSAGPGMPVEVQGLEGVPQAGDPFDVVKDETDCQRLVVIRKEELEKKKQPQGRATIEEIFAKAKAGDVKELNIVVKADVAGSLEALHGMFAKLSTPEVKLKIIHSAVGGIVESDALLAATSKAMVVGFNVRPDTGATQLAKSHGLEIRTYSIVYELIDDMKKAMGGLLTPDIVEKVLGKVEVRNIFTVPKIGTIAGCFVTDGKIARSNMARLVRDGKIIYEGKITSLKRFKDDAKEVATGFECGIGIENYNDIKVGDVIEAFVKEEIARTLEQHEARA